MRALIVIESRGKVQAWSRIADRIGLTARVLASDGHVCGWPEASRPPGMDPFDAEKPETAREIRDDRMRPILEAIAATPRETAILLAMDADTEGDVIALDIAERIAASMPDRVPALMRILPGPITELGLRTSISMARPWESACDEMRRDAVRGRARAMSDRWFGAAFRTAEDGPVGRMRIAILGASLLATRRPAQLQGIAETGEVTFQARSASGGRPFFARVAIRGDEDPDVLNELVETARRFSGHLVPGAVRQIEPAGAQIAPRIGTVRPFNTVDALVYAARHLDMSPRLAMGGLQDAYLQGMISHPRTPNRHMGDESANRVTILGSTCGIEGLSAGTLSSAGRLQDLETGLSGPEGLHPVMPLSAAGDLRDILRRPQKCPSGGWDRITAMQAMTVLVSRRAFEASRDIHLRPGRWSPDNAGEVDRETFSVLSDLDWMREDGFAFPWTRGMLTGCRAWPATATVMEAMAIEDIAHPATCAAQAEAAISSGDIEAPPFPAQPRPSAEGMSLLKSLPSAAWMPATCRLINAALEGYGGGEKDGDDVAERARIRVKAWFSRLPPEMSTPLLDAIGRSGSDAPATDGA